MPRDTSGKDRMLVPSPVRTPGGGRCTPHGPLFPPPRHSWGHLTLAAWLTAGWLVGGLYSSSGAEPRPPEPPEICFDDSQLLQAGLHRVASQRLILYTDVAPSPEIEQLGMVFDAAYPQWCEFFGIAPGSKPWQMRGFLMKDPQLFRSLGVLPPWLPPFSNGFSVGDVLWIYEQPSAYYRRHLLIHEGTHGFLRAHFGQQVPPWYNEGIAELLGTHFWDGRTLRLAYLPRSREEVPLWGRIKIVRDAVAAERPLAVFEILDFGPTAHRNVEPYGWCWALTALLENDSRFHEPFRQLVQFIDDPSFNKRLVALLGSRWKDLQYQWLIVLADLDYGYDFLRTVTDFRPGAPVLPQGHVIRVEAAKGWQNSGLVLEDSRTYELSATGRFVIAQDNLPWESEPQGVTIRYHRGKPLGALLAAVVPTADEHPDPLVEVRTAGSFFRPILVGRHHTLTPPRKGTLFLRVNDSPAELGDNSGEVIVRLTPRP